MTARTKPAAPTPRDRIAVASRIVAATAGGYGVAAFATIALGTILPVAPVTATIASMLAGLLVMPVVAMAVFRTRSAARGWAGIVVAALVLAGVALGGGWRA